MQTPELVKVYTEKAAKALREAIEKSAPKKKTVSGDGEFEVVATTEGVDRDGEVIKVSGWISQTFKRAQSCSGVMTMDLCLSVL
jgi:hypothetical protein